MHNNTQFFIGIDVSKPWFDAALLPVSNHQKKTMVNERFDNTVEGIKVFGKWLKNNKVTLTENTLLVIENTGIYHRLLWSFCSKHSLPCTLAMPPILSGALALPALRVTR